MELISNSRISKSTKKDSSVYYDMKTKILKAYIKANKTTKSGDLVSLSNLNLTIKDRLIYYLNLPSKSKKDNLKDIANTILSFEDMDNFFPIENFKYGIELSSMHLKIKKYPANTVLTFYDDIFDKNYYLLSGSATK